MGLDDLILCSYLGSYCDKQASPTSKSRLGSLSHKGIEVGKPLLQANGG